MHLAFRSVSILFGIAIGLLLAEAGVRFFVDPKFYVYLDSCADWVRDRELGWFHRPDEDVTTRTPFGWDVRFRTNRDGIATEIRPERNPGLKRVLFVGDSTVLGRAVPYDQTVTAQLERVLADSGIRAEVINAGVQGYSTDQALILAKRLVPLYRPDLVVYGLCSNDFAANASDREYGLPKPRFIRDGEGLKLVPPSRDDSAQAFCGSGWKKALSRSALVRTLSPFFHAARAKLIGYDSTLGLGHPLYFDPLARKDLELPLFEDLLLEMRSFSVRHGAEFIFYSHPDLAEVWPPFATAALKREGVDPAKFNPRAFEEILSDVSVRKKITYVPVIARFKANESRGPFHLLPRNPHCNPSGYRVLAEALAPEVSRRLRGSDHSAPR